MPDQFTYECLDCNSRTEADERPDRCPACGGALVNKSFVRWVAYT